MGTYSSEQWDAWMRAALGGDGVAYDALLKALLPWLKAYFTRRLRGADIDDLVQMTLLSVHTKRHTYDAAQPFMPWVSAVARHKLIDYVRQNKRRVMVELDDNLAGDHMEPSLALRDLEALLQQLPPEQAEVVRLHKLKDLSVEEVSRLTGKSEANIKVIVHRALKKLQVLVGGGAASVKKEGDVDE